jgi:hypothetical protein
MVSTFIVGSAPCFAGIVFADFLIFLAFNLLRLTESKLKNEKTEAEKSMWDNFLEAPQEVYDMVMDPSKKEREEEDKLRKEVKASKKAWRHIRRERFAFLDSGDGGDRQSVKTGMESNVEEKKIDESTVGFGQ